LIYNTGESHLVIDGESHLKHSPYPATTRFLIFRGLCYYEGIIEIENFSSSRMSHGLVIRNCELDGSQSVNNQIELMMMYCDSFVVENNYIHNGGTAPTGDVQESPDCFFMRSCAYGKVMGNVVKFGNHGLIDMAAQGFSEPECHHITISNNVLDSGWGGCLYLVGASYCLVDNNLFLHSGGSTVYPKPALQMNGSNNTVRRNIFYNPHNEGISLNAQHQSTMKVSVLRHNLIYNNTFYNDCTYGNLFILVDNLSCDSCCVEYNGFYNNIFYKSASFWGGGGGYVIYSEINMALYNSNFNHNWVTPDVAGARPVSTAWGGNKFHNNLIRHDARGLAKDSLIVWGPDGHLGGGYVYYTGNAVNADGSGAWANNIGNDPRLASETPDAYGTGWWYLQSSSPCINAGVPVNDYNGAAVTAVAPAYGWGNLTYAGSAPDIGAYEWGGENPSPPSVPPLSSFPGRK
jgi:parallel beta-helix repeat protein